MSDIRTIDGWQLQRFQSSRSGKWRVLLMGKVDGDPRVTSALASIEGDVVTTHSGSRYRLGAPGFDIVRRVKHHGGVYNPAAPLAGLGDDFTWEWMGVRGEAS